MNLTVVKFGGSTIGEMGNSIPSIVDRIREIGTNSKVMAVFSAPLTLEGGKRRSLTDVIISQGNRAERQIRPDLTAVWETYNSILDTLNGAQRNKCIDTVRSYMAKAQDALDESYNTRRFADSVRARALGYSGELLMAQVMYHILQDKGMSVDVVPYDRWPIITDDNLEFTNFLPLESQKSVSHTAALLQANDIVCMGGFIGKTRSGHMTTYERGGTDRTAVDMAILLHKEYQTSVDWEKDSSVMSADPRVVGSGLTGVAEMSYNEARLAGMFGMRILDPIAVKEIVNSGLDIPLRITNMGDPAQTTTIIRQVAEEKGHPIKIVTGKGNCVIMHIDWILTARLLKSLEEHRQYGEFVLLSPVMRGSTRFSRILFTDGEFVRRNKRYLLSFDPLAFITYNRGVITLIGGSMRRVQHVVSKTSARIGDAGINILNMDAQEDTARILIVIEDTGDNLDQAVRAVHAERPHISFV